MIIIVKTIEKKMKHNFGIAIGIHLAIFAYCQVNEIARFGRELQFAEFRAQRTIRSW